MCFSDENNALSVTPRPNGVPSTMYQGAHLGLLRTKSNHNSLVIKAVKYASVMKENHFTRLPIKPKPEQRQFLLKMVNFEPELKNLTCNNISEKCVKKFQGIVIYLTFYHFKVKAYESEAI